MSSPRLRAAYGDDAVPLASPLRLPIAGSTAPLTGSTPSPTPTPRTWPAAQTVAPPYFHQNLKNSRKSSYHIFNLDHKDVSAAS